MPSLNQKPTLSDFQQYVSELEDERGFTDQNVLQKCLMLGLEKAFREKEEINKKRVWSKSN